MKSCEFCGADITAKWRQYPTTKYCDRGCRDRAYEARKEAGHVRGDLPNAAPREVPR